MLRASKPPSAEARSSGSRPKPPKSERGEPAPRRGRSSRPAPRGALSHCGAACLTHPARAAASSAGRVAPVDLERRAPRCRARHAGGRRTASFAVVTSGARSALPRRAQRGELGLAVAMMIGKGVRARPAAAPSRAQRGEEFLRPADAGEGDDARAGKPLAVAPARAAPRRTGLAPRRARRGGRVAAHQHDGVGAGEPGRDRLAQRSRRHARGRCRSRRRRRSPAATDPWRAAGF